MTHLRAFSLFAGLFALTLLSLSAPAAADPKLEGDLGLAPASWDACEGVGDSGRYLLGRFSRKNAVVEVEATNSPAVAKLWAHAKPGGSNVSWAGGRAGVRHVDLKAAAGLSPALDAGRLYIWDATNGWNSDLARITGVELAKSLCNASTIVLYATLNVEGTGDGILVASATPPDQSTEPLSVSANPSKAVVSKIYEALLSKLDAGLRGQKLVPGQLTMSILPGHFTGSDLEYAVSVKWGNAFDDRFSFVSLADSSGALTQVLDTQEGGAAGLAAVVADLGDSKTQDLIYELTTLDGSTVALWSFKDHKVVPLVQTTPVGE